MRLYHHKKLCWILSLALGLQPILGWQQQAAAQASDKKIVQEPTADDPVDAENLARLIKTLRDLSDPGKLAQQLDLLEKMSKQESLAAFDVKAKANELGARIEDIFAFVRDEVRYEAYEGVLRGPRGTLMALAGNSFDKSLLLAELLTVNGVDVRFVRGQLSAEQSESLVSQMFQEVREQANRAAVANDDASEIPPKLVEGANAFAKVNIARWLVSLESVGDALRKSEIGVGSEPPVPRQALVAEASDHCWIEVNHGGTWTALDACFNDAEPGSSYASATEHMKDLSPAAHQHVVIRLQLEQRDAGGLKTEEILKYDAKAAELNGAAVSLHFDLSSENSSWTAMPVLRIDDGEIRGQKISAPAGGLAAGVAQLGGNLFNRPRGEAIEQGITAMWLDFDFILPNGTQETVRRELFDRIGLAARNEKRDSNAPLTALPANGLPPALAGILAFSFSTGTLHPGLLQRRFVRQLPLVREAIASTAAPKTIPSQVTADDQTLLFAESLWVLAASFHMRSQANIQMAVSSGVWKDVWFYEASPRLAIVHFAPANGEGGTPNTFELKLDLRRNDLRPVAEKTAGSGIVWANVSRGLLDAALEHVMFVDSAITSTAANLPSTIALVEQARQTGVEFGVVLSQDYLSRLNIPADTKARLFGDFHEPIALIAPAKAIVFNDSERVGWWRVDLTSGETLAVMDSGLHEGGLVFRSPYYVQDSVEIGLMGYVQAIVIVGCMTVFPAVFSAWLWGEMQSQQAYRQGFNDGLNAATENMVNRHGVPDPRDGAIDYSVSPSTGRPNGQ